MSLLKPFMSSPLRPERILVARDFHGHAEAAVRQLLKVMQTLEDLEQSSERRDVLCFAPMEDILETNFYRHLTLSNERFIQREAAAILNLNFNCERLASADNDNRSNGGDDSAAPALLSSLPSDLRELAEEGLQKLDLEKCLRPGEAEEPPPPRRNEDSHTSLPRRDSPLSTAGVAEDRSSIRSRSMDRDSQLREERRPASRERDYADRERGLAPPPPPPPAARRSPPPPARRSPPPPARRSPPPPRRRDEPDNDRWSARTAGAGRDALEGPLAGRVRAPPPPPRSRHSPPPPAARFRAGSSPPPPRSRRSPPPVAPPPAYAAPESQHAYDYGGRHAAPLHTDPYTTAAMAAHGSSLSAATAASSANYGGYDAYAADQYSRSSAAHPDTAYMTQPTNGYHVVQAGTHEYAPSHYHQAYEGEARNAAATTGTTTSAVAAVFDQQDQPPWVKPPWEPVWSKSRNRYYFYNTETFVNSWEYPQ